MPIPAPVMDLLNSLDIVGIPTRIEPGQKFTATLTPSLTGFDAFAVAKTLATIDVSMVLEEVSITTLLNNVEIKSDPLSSTTNVDNIGVVSKAVEFTSMDPAIKPLDVIGPLPYLDVSTTPATLSNAVQGYHSNIAGKLTTDVASAVAKISGELETTIAKIAGTVKGAINAPALVPKIDYKVVWTVKNARGNVLAPGVDYSESPEQLLEGAPVSVVFAFFPEFVEATRGDPPVSQRFISCDVTVVINQGETDEQKETRTIGPKSIDLPAIPIPVVAVLTEHPNFQGAALIAVPDTSPFADLSEIDSVLQKAIAALNTVGSVTATFAPTLNGLNTVKAALSLSQKRFWRASQLDSLGDICFATTTVVVSWCNKDAWRMFSALALLGPPGKTLSCHNLNNQWVHHGVFTLATGTACVAVISDFTTLSNPPAADPLPAPMGGFAGPGVCTVTARSDRTSVWNDTMQSYHFL